MQRRGSRFRETSSRGMPRCTTPASPPSPPETISGPLRCSVRSRRRSRITPRSRQSSSMRKTDMRRCSCLSWQRGAPAGLAHRRTALCRALRFAFGRCRGCLGAHRSPTANRLRIHDRPQLDARFSWRRRRPHDPRRDFGVLASLESEPVTVCPCWSQSEPGFGQSLALCRQRWWNWIEALAGELNPGHSPVWSPNGDRIAFETAGTANGVASGRPAIGVSSMLRSLDRVSAPRSPSPQVSNRGRSPSRPLRNRSSSMPPPATPHSIAAPSCCSALPAIRSLNSNASIARFRPRPGHPTAGASPITQEKRRCTLPRSMDRTPRSYRRSG